MTVFESVLIEEYQRAGRILASIQEELERLPAGYLRKKIVNGKAYYYRQYRDGNKMVSKYVKKAEVEKVRKLMEIRKEDEECVKEMKKTIKQIERALGKPFINAELSKGNY